MNKAVEILSMFESDIKMGDWVKIDIKKAGLIPQQIPIIKQMLKRGGGNLLIKSIEGNYANVAGSEAEALIMGTLRVPLVCLYK